MNINQIISAFIAVGGLGFINYMVADQLGLINFNQNDSQIKIPFMVAWSVPDFTIYLLIGNLVTDKLKLDKDLSTAVTLITTFIIVYILCVFLSKPIFKLSEWLINCRRSADNKTKQFTGDTLDHVLDNNKVQSLYIYNFDNSPVAEGLLDYYSGNQTLPYQMSIVPFNDRTKPTSYDDLLMQVSTEKFKRRCDINIYIDYEKKVKMIVLTEKQKKH